MHSICTLRDLPTLISPSTGLLSCPLW